MLEAYSYPPFTQLWAWGEAQAALGKRVVRHMASTASGTWLVQWIEERRGPFCYWFAPQGPVIPESATREELGAFLSECRARLGTITQRALFYRIEPRVRGAHVKTHIEANAFSGVLGQRVRSLNPATSFVVDLTGSADEVFERFHKKTRYNVRLAERHAVVVRGGTEQDIPVFLDLMRETAKRDGFVGHDDRYVRTVCGALMQSGCGKLRVAECLGKPLAVNLEVLCGDTVMYLYGASSSEDREKMAAYALQWSAIFAARQEGVRWYDFGGGNPERETDPEYRPSWEGITRFKERWGAQRVQELGTFDLVAHPWLYRLLVRR